MTEPRVSFFPATTDSGGAIAAGFRFGHVGVHTSRTIMLDEVTATLAAVPANGKRADYAAAIMEDNCLGKDTASNRRLTFRRLRELYVFDPAVPIFRILRRLWDLDPEGQPLLALLTSLARDPILLATADVILNLPERAELSRVAMRDALAHAVKDRLNDSILDKVIRNAASSWCKSGHLEGRTFKTRKLARATPASTAFALYLARAAGFTIDESWRSGWLKILDVSQSEALELASSAKRLGFIDLRMAGDVVELNLSRLDPR